MSKYHEVLGIVKMEMMSGCKVVQPSSKVFYPGSVPVVSEWIFSTVCVLCNLLNVW